MPPPATMKGCLDLAIALAAILERPISGRGLRICHSRSAKNSSGTSIVSAWTSSGRQIVTAPVSAGSVNTRIAPRSELKSCSGRLMRSKNLESGLNASFTDIVRSYGCSSCCSTGSDTRFAKVSAGKSRTGNLFVVATAAPVNILVAPGPTEDAQAKVARRRDMRAKADDS